AVCRFEHRVLVAEVRAGRETESADEARAQIADDVAEHVFRNEYGVILRILEHPHADGVDVHFVGPNVRIVFGYVPETTHHQPARFTEHIWFLDYGHAFASGFLGEFKRFPANVGATLHAHDAGGERDILQTLVLPLLHFRIRAQRGVN